MNALDRAQDLNMLDLQEIQLRARLPDVAPPTEPRYCGSCGDEIPPLRLQAWPHAKACVGCAEHDEAQARHRGRIG